MSHFDCIFCKIVAGDIPALRVHEDDAAIAFVDINPLAPGHTLLIPRKHYRDITSISADELAVVTAVLPKLAKAVLNATGAAGLNLLQNTGAASGQAVFHLHFHLIPRVEGDSIGYRWNAGKYQAGEAETWQEKISAALAP